MPPSLRRSASSPSVRVAPYPTSSSSSSSSNSASSAGHAGRPRRGTSDAGRRVLADIEWWRVMQGQQEDGDENTAEAEAEAHARQAQVQEQERDEQTEPPSTPPPPRTPEPISPLYTVSEDAYTDQPSSGASSTDSTPSRSVPLPLFTMRPRHASRSLSFPGLTLADLGIHDEDEDASMADTHAHRGPR